MEIENSTRLILQFNNESDKKKKTEIFIEIIENKLIDFNSLSFRDSITIEGKTYTPIVVKFITGVTSEGLFTPIQVIRILEKIKEVNAYISNPMAQEMSEFTSRFSGAMWYENLQKKSITVAGIGGIGSYVVFLLSRMNPALITIYDDDEVEAVNLSGQLFCLSNIGQSKVFSACEMAQQYSNYYSISSFKSKFTISSPASDIMICGFDNMKARQTYFNSWKNHVDSKPKEERGNCLFIDGRLAAEELQVLAFTGIDEHAIIEYQNNWLFDDSEAEETICSFKQTTFMANMIGSFMVNIFVNFVANECKPIIDRAVPFFTSYAADSMFLKMEM